MFQRLNRHPHSLTKYSKDYLQRRSSINDKFLIRQVKFEEIQSKYQILGTLSQTHNSTVKLGIYKRTGDQVVFKILNACNPRGLYLKEIRILQQFKGKKHINELYDYFEYSNQIWLVLEYASEGDLYHYLKQQNFAFNEETTRNYFLQILRAVSQLHEKKIAHRDLKLENILIDINQRIILGDFGFAVEMGNTLTRNDACGTPCYSCPEMLEGLEYDPFLSDSWSLGVILFVLFFGKFPFLCPTVTDFIKQTTTRNIEIPDYINPLATDLIKGLLQKNPKDRLTVAKALQHPWLVSVKSLPPQKKTLRTFAHSAFVIPPKYDFDTNELNDEDIVVSTVENSLGKPNNTRIFDESLQILSLAPESEDNKHTHDDQVALSIVSRRLRFENNITLGNSRARRSRTTLLRRAQTLLPSHLKRSVIVLPKKENVFDGQFLIAGSSQSLGLCQSPLVKGPTDDQVQDLLLQQKGKVPLRDCAHSTLEAPERVWEKIVNFIVEREFEIVYSNDDWSLLFQRIDGAMFLVELGCINEDIGLIGYSIASIHGNEECLKVMEGELEDYVTF